MQTSPSTTLLQQELKQKKILSKSKSTIVYKKLTRWPRNSTKLWNILAA